ncbi:MAG: hypothetical protein M1819_003744 [Sarea resinae]|nr:MAG: hypothetical protein M1819_003744 [Sarea resinae]
MASPHKHHHKHRGQKHNISTASGRHVHNIIPGSTFPNGSDNDQSLYPTHDRDLETHQLSALMFGQTSDTGFSPSAAHDPKSPQSASLSVTEARVDLRFFPVGPSTKPAHPFRPKNHWYRYHPHHYSPYGTSTAIQASTSTTEPAAESKSISAAVSSLAAAKITLSTSEGDSAISGMGADSLDESSTVTVYLTMTFTVFTTVEPFSVSSIPAAVGSSNSPVTTSSKSTTDNSASDSYGSGSSTVSSVNTLMTSNLESYGALPSMTSTSTSSLIVSISQSSSISSTFSVTTLLPVSVLSPASSSSQAETTLSSLTVLSSSSTVTSALASSLSSAISSLTEPYSIQSLKSSSSSTTSVVQASALSSSTINYGSGPSIIAPALAGTNLNGISSNSPTNRYINLSLPPEPKLPLTLLVDEINGALSTNYSLCPDTGVLMLDKSTESLLSDLTGTPHLSRDGGKGGYLNGERLFIFCDTGSYTPPSEDAPGNFLGFVSSSATVDDGMNAASGQALTLVDGIGQWADEFGRQRGFSPMTTGEENYNLVMQGQGQRYAVWPESSLVPFNSTNGLLFASIIFDNVTESTKQAVFIYTGMTLLSVTVPSEGGPVANRVVQRLFEENEVAWGSIGGIRSYGPSGVGGNDGRVYVFGNIDDKGMLLARVDADKVTDHDSYEYWDGLDWTNGMQTSSSEAFFVAGSFMDGDIFYSPAHLTFIFVYLNCNADNTFYFRYLQAESAILPPSAPGGDPSSDYVENLVKYSWSEEQVLYEAEPGPTGRFIYAGGVHQGYFGVDDIINGGKKMLLSWTAPTGGDPAAMASEYSHVTAVIEWE